MNEACSWGLYWRIWWLVGLFPSVEWKDKHGVPFASTWLSGCHECWRLVAWKMTMPGGPKDAGPVWS
jgi:hypothetical protein